MIIAQAVLISIEVLFLDVSQMYDYGWSGPHSIELLSLDVSKMYDYSRGGPHFYRVIADGCIQNVWI